MTHITEVKEAIEYLEKVYLIMDGIKGEHVKTAISALRTIKWVLKEELRIYPSQLEYKFLTYQKEGKNV
jgi:hypothetical protein